MSEAETDLGSRSDMEEKTPSPILNIKIKILAKLIRAVTSEAITGHGIGSFSRIGTWNINTLYQVSKLITSSQRCTSIRGREMDTIREDIEIRYHLLLF